MDHGGTPEERQAIDDAISGMKVLRREAAEWQHREVSEVRLLTLELTKRASLQASKCDHLRPAILSSQKFF
jgi:hypothetical protein